MKANACPAKELLEDLNATFVHVGPIPPHFQVWCLWVGLDEVDTLLNIFLKVLEYVSTVKV